MSRTPFPSLRVAGGLLPPDLFGRVLEDNALAGRQPVEYGLGKNRTVREAASRAFDDLSTEWHSFVRDRDRAEREGRPLGGLTRDWLRALLRELDFGILAAAPAGGLIVEDKPFKVSHIWQHVPIHLLPWSVDFDHRTKGVAGAADAAPQSMVQELLNRSDEHLWAIVSNGQKLRLLRDSRSLAGSAYVEFDLELIFTEHLFSDFVLLFRLVHASRFAVGPAEQPSACWLEKWRTTAIAQGERALERLRVGVEQAITTLGTGFLRHPANAELRERLAAGTLGWDDFKRSILRVVYRLLFWFVTEDRDVLLDPDQELVAQRARYLRFFSAHRLRERARRGSADHHEDLWEAVRLVFVALGSEEGEQRLALPGIGGIFERITRDDDDNLIVPSTPDELDEPLEGQRLTNEAVITAVRHLAIVDSNGQRRPVDFRNLDSEELGSVYESLLELHPNYDPAEQTFTLVVAPGNERKATGSYYTPSALTDALLDSALNPILDEVATSAGDSKAKVEALLKVTVCDPACGSGHFLVAAARRIARRVAQIRSGESEPSPTVVRHAMREVVSRCIHGVDINEMAAELAKVSLWLESVEPGKPLPFLDANIRVGDSLLGTTPALIERGIQKEAFRPLDGDDKQVAASIAEDNTAQQEGQAGLFAVSELILSNSHFGEETSDVVQRLPTKLADVATQRRRLKSIDALRVGAKMVADAWCSAFVQRKTIDTRPLAITRSTLDWIANPSGKYQTLVSERVKEATRYFRFFHWHIEFPHIFIVNEGSSPKIGTITGWSGGFDCIIGNPPWERIAVEDDQFFATRAPAVLEQTTTAKRKKAIDGLRKAQPQIYSDYQAAHWRSSAISHLITESGLYRLTAVGRITTQSLFATIGLTVTTSHGICGLILPTGVVTDVPMAKFWRWLVEERRITKLIDFENKGIFPIHRSTKFSLITFVGSARASDDIRLTVGMYLTDTSEINDPGKLYSFPLDKLAVISPNNLQLPICRSQHDVEVLIRAMSGQYTRMEITPWVGFTSEGHSSKWTEETRSVDSVPLIEGKMVHQYDSCHATYLDATDADRKSGRPRSARLSEKGREPITRYFADRKLVLDFLARKKSGPNWVCVIRDYARATDIRTAISTIVATTVPIQPLNGYSTVEHDATHDAWALAGINSFAYDFIARQKTPGQHFNVTIMSQVPIPQVRDEWSQFVIARVLELTYISQSLAPLAQSLGDNGRPFAWDESRRLIQRAELDALFFHLYGIDRDDTQYILKTFPIAMRQDQKAYGEYRTINLVVEFYDSIAKSIETGEQYKNVLDPPPGHGPRHPARTDSH